MSFWKENILSQSRIRGLKTWRTPCSELFDVYLTIPGDVIVIVDEIIDETYGCMALGVEMRRIHKEAYLCEVITRLMCTPLDLIGALELVERVLLPHLRASCPTDIDDWVFESVEVQDRYAALHFISDDYHTQLLHHRLRFEQMETKWA